MRLSHKIPVTPWRAVSTWGVRPRMLTPLFVGLVLFGVGEGLLVRSRLGATPWTVFAQGLALHGHLSLGWASALISGVVLMAWFPLRERPGFGTVANLVVIALVLNLTADAVPSPAPLWPRALYVLCGVVAIGVGSALYLTTGLGPGPRDGLMTSLHRRLGVSVVYVRLTLESIVLVVGWLMGGTVGLATAIFATTIGFSIGASLHALQWFVGKVQR
ncbi:MAG TPA: hypothetical protein VMV53_00455 [Acidimicrobiales bacterium]|nr:hypothetical protein [Acidimicrobiales bacterium]